MSKETTDKGWIEVAKLGSGWAALHMKTITGPLGSSYDHVVDTSEQRHPTKLGAVYEAREWATDLGLEFREPKDETIMDISNISSMRLRELIEEARKKQIGMTVVDMEYYDLNRKIRQYQSELQYRSLVS